MKRTIGGLPLWMWGAGLVAVIGAASYLKKRSAKTTATPAAATSATTGAFSSQQQLQDFGIFQSLTQGQQGSDLQYLSTVLSLFGGSSSPSGTSTTSGGSGGGGGTLPTTVSTSSGAGTNPGGTATAVPVTPGSAASIAANTLPPGAGSAGAAAAASGQSVGNETSVYSITPAQLTSLGYGAPGSVQQQLYYDPSPADLLAYNNAQPGIPTSSAPVPAGYFQ